MDNLLKTGLNTRIFRWNFLRILDSGTISIIRLSTPFCLTQFFHYRLINLNIVTWVKKLKKEVIRLENYILYRTLDIISWLNVWMMINGWCKVCEEGRGAVWSEEGGYLAVADCHSGVRTGSEREEQRGT